MTPTIWHIYVGAGQPNDGKLAAGSEQFVKRADYDALAASFQEERGLRDGLVDRLNDRIRELAAERDELRKRANTRTDALNEAEALVESLQNKWASRPLSSEDQGQRIEALEAALRKIGYEPIGHAESTEREVLQAIVDIARSALETEVFKGMKDAPTWIDDETKGE